MPHDQPLLAVYPATIAMFDHQQKELQRLVEESAQRNKEELSNRHLHNINMAGNKYLYLDFKASCIGTDHSPAFLQNLKSNNTFKGFSLMFGSMPTGDLKCETRDAAASFFKDLQLPAGAWRSAQYVSDSNHLYNIKKHGDVEESAVFVMKEWEGEGLSEEQLEVRGMVLAVARAAQRHAPEIRQEQQAQRAAWLKEQKEMEGGQVLK